MRRDLKQLVAWWPYRQLRLVTLPMRRLALADELEERVCRRLWKQQWPL